MCRKEAAMIKEETIVQRTQWPATQGGTASLAKILVATDFSPVSDRALEYALSLARSYNSRIYLTHVIPVDVMMAPELVIETSEKLRREAKEGMEKIVDAKRFLGVAHDEVIAEGTFWPTIEALIEKYGIDLIVAGTHGAGGVKKMLLGSAAEELFRRAPVPVLTVGPAVTREPFYEVELKNILFATDFGPGAEKQAEYAFSLAQTHRSRLTLLHVALWAGAPKLQETEREAFVHQLRELLPVAESTHCLPVFDVVVGEAVPQILRVAEEVRADLIVLGAKRQKSLAGHTTGSKAYDVVCKATCPVLTMKA
jgi:nucleotide-binding universal stress UspA family protein